jgi:hypothetical protein
MTRCNIYIFIKIYCILIMENINITSFFDYIIDKEKSIKIANLLNYMYETKLLNTELLLNCIKALILIFYLDKNSFDIYYNILHYINNDMNKNIRELNFNKLKSINLSHQLELNNNIVEDIIIYTNLYILANNNNIDKMIIDLINLITNIQQLNTTFEVKTFFYLNILKKSKIEHINLVNVDIISKINHFIE